MTFSFVERRSSLAPRCVLSRLRGLPTATRSDVENRRLTSPPPPASLRSVSTTLPFSPSAARTSASPSRPCSRTSTPSSTAPTPTAAPVSAWSAWCACGARRGTDASALAKDWGEVGASACGCRRGVAGARDCVFARGGGRLARFGERRGRGAACTRRIGVARILPRCAGVHAFGSRFVGRFDVACFRSFLAGHAVLRPGQHPEDVHVPPRPQAPHPLIVAPAPPSSAQTVTMKERRIDAGGGQRGGGGLRRGGGCRQRRGDRVLRCSRVTAAAACRKTAPCGPSRLGAWKRGGQAARSG